MEDKMKYDEKCEVKHTPVGERWPEGTGPGLSKDYGKKDDADLTNGFVPQTRKN